MTPDAPLHEVIQDLEQTDVTVAQLALGRADAYPDLFPKLLMACEGDQVKFLTYLYSPYMEQDVNARIGWLGAVKNGFLLDLLDPSSSKAQDLLRFVQFAIMTTTDRLGAQVHVCSRCKRTRR